MYAKPNSEQKSQDAKISELSSSSFQGTARSAENVAKYERKADLGEEATEMGKETSYASQV